MDKCIRITFLLSHKEWSKIAGLINEVPVVFTTGTNYVSLRKVHLLRQEYYGNS
jgi:hypothetical protein